MTDWLMVIITAVYVVATIAICVANFKSAKASREQLEESKRQFEEQKLQFEEQKRQYEETNRPMMSCQYYLENRAFCGIRFYNYGTKPACNVSFKVNEEFLNSLVDQYKIFKELNESNYFFGINQHYDFVFADISNFKNHKVDFAVDITYECEGKKYKDTVQIHFTKQLPVFSGDDQNLKELKNINNNLQTLNNEVRKLGNTIKSGEDNNV